MAEPACRREYGHDDVERPFVGATEVAVQIACHFDEVVAPIEHVDQLALPTQCLGGPPGLFR